MFAALHTIFVLQKIKSFNWRKKNVDSWVKSQRNRKWFIEVKWREKHNVYCFQIESACILVWNKHRFMKQGFRSEECQFSTVDITRYVQLYTLCSLQRKLESFFCRSIYFDWTWCLNILNENDLAKSISILKTLLWAHWFERKKTIYAITKDILSWLE